LSQVDSARTKLKNHGAVDDFSLRWSATRIELALCSTGEENGAVGARTGVTVLIMALFAVPMAWTAMPSAPQNPHPPHATSPPEMRIDVNHASVEELVRVPGMTRSWAGRIVRFRPYRTKQDLVDRGVVSGDVYNRIKDYIIAHREKQ
jgi:competence protein ComEA